MAGEMAVSDEDLARDATAAAERTVAEGAIERSRFEPVRILLIRHGPSAHVWPTWRLTDRAGIDRWRVDYDAAGIAKDSSAPPWVHSQVANADVVAASDLPRAVESASHLWPERPIVTLPLFREAPIHIPSLVGIPAPLPLWALLIHLRWTLDTVRGRDLSAEDRSRS